MTALLLFLLPGLPALSALLLFAAPSETLARFLNIGTSGVMLAASLALALTPAPRHALFLAADDLSLFFLLLSTFIGMTSSLFSDGYLAHERRAGRLSARERRLYHAMFQGLMASLALALLADGTGLMWFGVELGTLSAVLIVGLYRTPASLEAAWKYFILGSVGIALALFGTILLYLASAAVVGEGSAAMRWDVLLAHAKDFDRRLMDLAFVFLLLGYGTKASLVPLHAWLPDAHAEGPTPVSAVLSGLLLNVAFYAIIRFKGIFNASPAALAPQPIMIALGLLTLLFAALMLFRRRDLKRFFAYSSVEHMGLLAFALGIGGASANFAALWHLLMHGLTKSALFFLTGRLAQLHGSQKIADLTALTETHPALGVSLVLGMLAIAGFPPFGLFASEYLLFRATLAAQAWLALPLLGGLLLAAAALLLRLGTLAFPSPGALPASPAARPSSWRTVLPAWLHFGLVLWAGLAMPGPIAAWLGTLARGIG